MVAPAVPNPFIDRGSAAAVGFPLADWIDEHDGVPHNLARSGMGGGLRSLPRIVGRGAAPDAGALRRELARLLRVEPARVFLTHGATEGNTSVLFFLAGEIRRAGARVTTARVDWPDYPPLTAIAAHAGFRRSTGAATVRILSRPNNPTGISRRVEERADLFGTATRVHVDETFREFTNAPSLAREDWRGLWTTGSFTKVYGADRIRVGYVVAPTASVAGFGRFHGLVLDGLADASISAARAILAHREELLAESRAIFRENLRYLHDRLPDAPDLVAPLWFDRFDRRLDGDVVARALLRRGVLVCPGRYFGDRHGVRVCLTQRSFPRDFDAYLRVRRRWT